MNIMTIGNFTTGWDGSICDEAHIANSLESIGHNIIRVPREAFSSPGTHVPIEQLDFVLLSQWDGYHPSTIELIKAQTLAPVVYWAFDYQRDGQEWHEHLIQGADLYLSKRFSDSKYPNWQWLAQDFAPNFLDRFPDQVEKDIDVLFTGSYIDYATERNETLKAINKKFDLTVCSITSWPEEFKNVQGPVMDDALPNLIARAKVVISIDAVIERGYWSDRNAQTMACGGYVLFRHAPMSESVFGPGVDYFYSIEDCLAKIERALADDSYRDFVSNIGYQQAHSLNRLMVDGRVYDLLTIVGGIL